jgi:hypothetical protein
MSLARRLRTVACCAVLEVGTLLGIPMRPEQIQDLMRAMNVPKIAETNPEESHSGDGDGDARPPATLRLRSGPP